MKKIKTRSPRWDPYKRAAQDLNRFHTWTERFPECQPLIKTGGTATRGKKRKAKDLEVSTAKAGAAV
jgi:hypothetical protein